MPIRRRHPDGRKPVSLLRLIPASDASADLGAVVGGRADQSSQSPRFFFPPPLPVLQGLPPLGMIVSLLNSFYPLTPIHDGHLLRNH